MQTAIRFIGIVVGILAFALLGFVFLLTHTFVDKLPTVEFPGHEVQFKLWAESDFDIQHHWVHFYVEYGEGHRTEERCLLERWKGNGTLTQYVSKDERMFVARWELSREASFFIVFDREQQDCLTIEVPLPGWGWPSRWRQPYEKLQLEYPVLPELKWELPTAESGGATIERPVSRER